MLKKLVATLVDFALPSQCPWCRNNRSVCVEGIRSLCDRCREEVVPASTDHCLRCSAEVGPYLETSSGCAVCRRDTYAFASAVSLGTYRGGLRSAVLRSKMPGGDALTAALTAELWHRWQEMIRNWSCDAIVSVPHYWTERSFRGHIPASTIADVLGGFLLVPVERHILSKRRWTRPQASLSATERRQNLKDAFKITGFAKLEGLKILVVDDVMTTGTTADRVARTLKSAGAAEIHVAVLARGTGHESNPSS